jgi:uncharacterized protein (TIGR03435 family)
VYRTAAAFLLALAMATASSVYGQSPQPTAPKFAYDIVSIRPNNSGDGSTSMGPSANGYTAKNITVAWLIEYAYNIKMESLVSGLPSWATSDRLNLEARMDQDSAAAINKLSKEEKASEQRRMLQAMLADRFHLQVQHTQKEVPVYALVVAKGGTRLKPADPNDPYGNGIKLPQGFPKSGVYQMTADGKFVAQGIPISMLANQLATSVDRLVVDKTGLTGNYDFTMQWDQDPDPSKPDAGPSLFTALQEQLGLKLESTKDNVDALIVTHVEKASDN